MKTISEYLSIINNAKSILTSKLNNHGKMLLVLH